MDAVHWYVPESLGSKSDICRVPLLTLVRPCGNGTSPLDQTIFGEGKPNAWQEADAFLPLLTVITMFGVLVNRGGTEEYNEKKKFYLSSLNNSQKSWLTFFEKKEKKYKQNLLFYALQPFIFKTVITNKLFSLARVK